MTSDSLSVLSRQHPYDMLPADVLQEVADKVSASTLTKGADVYRYGQMLEGLYLILDGTVSVTDQNGNPVSMLQRGNSFGERGLLRDGKAATSAKVETDTELLCLPRAVFNRLMAEQEPFRKFFNRAPAEPISSPIGASNLATVEVADLMHSDPVVCTPDTPIKTAACLMRDKRISCLCVIENGQLIGIVTLRDLTGKALAEGLPPETHIHRIMTPNPRVLSPTAMGMDVLHSMSEHHLGHFPIVQGNRLVGIVTQTDLTRYQAAHTADFVADAAEAQTAEELATISSKIPALLVRLVAEGLRHDVLTRMITDIADVITRRLLHLAEAKLGPAPGRYLWLACGSQGRQEQTGVSDQDNCLIMEDGLGPATDSYFEEMARFVCDGLNECGYIYCPGDMMATNPRWRQPVSVWRDYFRGWINKPNKEAQMLASVMFDLRPIGGDKALFDGLHLETLRAASANSIFTAHMASNALTHATPLGLLRSFATIRSGDHRNTIDTKLNGVVPVVDLARMYALEGELIPVNTRARLKAALEARVVSASGGRDLLDAYDLIADTRLKHQAGLIKQGHKPDNFLPPASLSDFERSHLRNAFVVVKTMQSGMMQGRGLLG